MIAYDVRGAILVMNEGAEILVHDGPSEGPLWRKTLDAPIVGLGADSDRVVAITASGTVTWFAARTGDAQGTASLGAKVALAIVDMPTRRVVAIAADKIVAQVGDTVTTLADHTARTIALAADGTVLAATDAGELVTLAADGTRVATASTHGPFDAVAWHPGGFWLVGAQRSVLRFAGTGDTTHVTNLPKGSIVNSLACSAKAIAIGWDERRVITLAWPSKETLGSLNYLENKVEGVAFGPWPWLGIAINGGDGNKQNLDNATSLHRTDTHPGRDHHRWFVSIGGKSEDDAPPKPKATAAASSGAVSAPRGQPTPPGGSRVVLLVGFVAIIAIALYFLMH